MSSTGKWLLVYNCVGIGLANCLRLLAPGIEFEAIDIAGFRRNFADYRDRIGDFDLVVAAPHSLADPLLDFSTARAVQPLPVVYYDAYHPDLCYLSTGAGLLKGPLGDYHSKIITAAWMRGIAEADVAALFCARRYRAFGYFERWKRSRTGMLQAFARVGVPLDAYFPRWSLRGPFMHSVNHPAIHVVHDIARALLDSREVDCQRSAVLPHDNLLNGPVWPVFDEIAEHLSVDGSYRFKMGAQYRCLALDEFIAASYALLAKQDPATLHCHAAQRASFDQVLAAS